MMIRGPLLLSFRFYIGTLFLIIAFHANSAGSQDEYPVLCGKGVDFLTNHQTDSALFYFSQAFRTGMSQDSFYYFWAETYLDRGSPDSAFVLNYSIHVPEDSSFNSKVLEQRYIIYSSLGWSDKAKAILDTLSKELTPKTKGRAWRLFLPALSFRTGEGFSWLKENQNESPFPSEKNIQTLQEPNYRNKLSVRWILPIFRNISIAPSVGFSIRNQSRETVTKDSVGKTLSLSNDFLFGNAFDFTYSWHGTKVTGDQTDFVHDFSLSKIISTDAWNLMFYGDFSLLKSNKTDLSGKYATLYGYYDKMLRNKHTLSTSLLVCGQWFPTDKVTNTITNMFIEDVSADSDKIVHLYNDSLKPIPSSYPPSTLPNYQNNTDIIVLDEIIPSKNYNFEGTLNYRIPIIWKMNISFSLDYSLLWYPRAFSWYSIIPEAPIDISEWKDDYYSGKLWGAYNQKDGKYYLASMPDLKSGCIIDHFSDCPVSIVTKKRIRLDNTISFSLGWSKAFGHFGTLGISAKGWKTISTLPKDAPVEIQYIGYTVSLDYSVNVSF